MKFNEKQQKAVKLAEDPTVKKLFITGSGGTGKSEVIKEIASHIHHEDMIILAPTHSAARLIGGLTIHSFFKVALELNTEAKKEEDAMQANLSNADFEKAFGKTIIIDEVSMLGKEMLEKIINLIPAKKLILVGDPMQLNPVKDQKVDWEEFCDTTVVLTHNYRTSNPDLLEAIDHYRKHTDDRVLELLPVVKNISDLVLRADTVCIAHKNSVLSEMQESLLGYSGAKRGDKVLTFGTSTDHFVELLDPRTKKMRKSPYFVNNDTMIITSDPIEFYHPELYSVEAKNVEYLNISPKHKNPKFPKTVQLLIGNFDVYKNILAKKFKIAIDFADEMKKKYATNPKQKAVNLKFNFTDSEMREWGRVWYDYLQMKSKAYARHHQFVTSYKVQGRSIDDVIVNWDDLPGTDHKFVALSRAKESIQILSSL